jgi:hypothetical protein
MFQLRWSVSYSDGRRTNWIESPTAHPHRLAIFLHEIGHHAIGFHRYRVRCEEEYRSALCPGPDASSASSPASRVQTCFDKSM